MQKSSVIFLLLLKKFYSKLIYRFKLKKRMESFNIEEPTDDFENKAFEVLRTSKASLLLNNNFPASLKSLPLKLTK